MEHSTLRALHEKPNENDSKHTHLTRLKTREVHDGTGTVIGVEKSESDGLVVRQLNFGRGVQGKSFLGYRLARSFMGECRGHIRVNPCFQCSRTFRPSTLAAP
jgi:hypothetical protein